MMRWWGFYLSIIVVGIFLIAESGVVLAAPAHCSPNAIITSTYYSNYAHIDDSFLSFTYDIDDQTSAVGGDGDVSCYTEISGRQIAIALIETKDVMGTIGIRDIGPAGSTTVYDHLIFGDNWGAAALRGTETADWVSFFFDLRLRRVGKPGLVEIELYATTEGSVSANQFLPLGDSLGHGVLNGDILPTSFSNTSYSPQLRINWDSGPILAAGTQNYTIVIHASAGDTNNRVEWRTSQDAADTNGNNYGSESTDGGETWVIMDGTATSPWIRWQGADLVVIDPVKILTVFEQEAQPIGGQNSGGLYFPLPMNSGPFKTISNFVLIIWDRTTTQPDVIYRLFDACLVVLDSQVSNFFLAGLTAFINLDDTRAVNVPILNLLMSTDSNGQNLSFNLGLDTVSAFLLITIAFSFALMLITARFTTNYFLIMLAGMIPPITLTMQGFLPVIVLTATGTFAGLVMTWQVMVRQKTG